MKVELLEERYYGGNLEAVNDGSIVIARIIDLVT